MYIKYIYQRSSVAKQKPKNQLPPPFPPIQSNLHTYIHTKTFRLDFSQKKDKRTHNTHQSCLTISFAYVHLPHLTSFYRVVQTTFFFIRRYFAMSCARYACFLTATLKTSHISVFVIHTYIRIRILYPT